MKKAQTEQVLDYIKAHGSITSMQAFSNLRITRLSAAVHTLRKRGYDIQTNMVKRNGSIFAEYILGGETEDAEI